jgi:glycosyltransferase involved in cell wall biosynthesis
VSQSYGYGVGHTERDGDATRAAGRDTVLHVVTRYQRGGSERRVCDIVAALPEFRHELLVGQDSDVDLAVRQTGAASVDVVPGLVRRVSPRDDAACLARLLRRLRTRPPLVLVTHQSKAGALARLVAVVGGVPVVHSLSMASFGPGYGRAEGLVFRRLEATLGRRTAGFTVVGADLAARFAALGVPADRLHVVRSAVPLPGRHELVPRAEVRRRLTERFAVPDDGPLVAYVGSLDARKNVLELPGVVAALGRRLGVAPAVVIAGEGPMRAALAAGLRAAGVAGRSVLTGHLSDPADVGAVMRGADALVLLSRAEGLPQVLVQAAAYGTPFVAFDVEGVTELLGLGARGVAVPFGGTDGVVAALADVLTDPVATREPVADLSSWSPDAIAAGHRRVVLAAARSTQAARRRLGGRRASAEGHSSA